MIAPEGAVPPARTLSDLYVDRPLTDAQARRLVALLGLTRWSETAPSGSPHDESAAPREAA